MSSANRRRLRHRADLRERGGEDLARVVDLLRCRRKRRNEPDDRAAPPDAEEQASLATPTLDLRAGLGRRRSVLADELEPLQDPAAAQVADDRILEAQLLQ